MTTLSSPVQRIHVSLVIDSVAPAHADEWAVDIKAAVYNWFYSVYVGDVVEVRSVNVSVEPPSQDTKATHPMQP